MKSDLKLIQADKIDVGDPDFFEQAYEEYFPSIYNYIRFRIWDSTAADDLTSLTFHKALDRLPSFDPSRASFSTWLFAIARNTVSDHLRAIRRRKLLLFGWWQDQNKEGPDPESELIDNEQRDRLLAALATLSEKERDILGLKFAGGKTNRAIAACTGQSESNVGVLAHRAIIKLRRRLQIGEEIR